MKRAIVLILAVLPYLLYAQSKSKVRKYPSLLWEITGNGLKKPSYLFGTMHVSSKLAFHLADSFYMGIRNADVVALETNPESWQEDMSKYETGEMGYSPSGRFAGYLAIPNDYLTINTLKFYKYDKKIERSLYSNPSTINNLLYRSYGNESSDFEEDTYLDMYIYQCGKKWGKKVAGVERYAESMKLMQEAYKDAAKDRSKKRSYEVDEEYSSGKLQEAYRKGNLDQLDSINKLNSFSEAFDEKFLYKRNEIQAFSIDSILKSDATLFVGVGAAHLPGKRGVIEILRDKGYILRPVMMGERDSRHKEEVEKVRVPVVFSPEIADDSLFEVSIPGKFYSFGDDGALDQKQYADMANGSYYMVTRIMTNGWMWGHSPEQVYKKIDSLLYENIPGKLISKTKISRNGFNGFDILNKTRRGDLQRYNIFITPFEVIFFKISGNGDYVKNGEEANKFFNSIKFRDYTTLNNPGGTWKKYSPATGGFSIDLPHEPYIGNDGSWIYDAQDRDSKIQYRVIRSDIHNYQFVEEDSFDLGLMEESFGASDFIDKKISRRFLVHQGYPALDCKFKDKSGGIYLLRFLIQGPHYYTLVAHGKQEDAKMTAFLNSFEIRPFIYPSPKERKDSALYFRVNSPVYPELKKEKLGVRGFSSMGGSDDDSDITEKDLLEGGAYRSKVIANDTTGERIYVSFYKSPRYYSSKDSSAIEKNFELMLMGDTSWIVRSSKSTQLPNKMQVWETKISDTGSSRMIWYKRFYKDGVGFSLLTQQDTLTAPSQFVQSFFESFTPADTLKGIDIFAKKSSFFFADFGSKDSIAHKRAVQHITMVELDSTDIGNLQKAINSLTFKEKQYLETKKALVAKLGDIKSKQAADYLKSLYYAAGDTIELQYAVLESLLQQQTQYATGIFRDIIVAEPPVIEKSQSGDFDYGNVFRDMSIPPSFRYSNGGFLDELYDSLALTRTILPDLMPLLNLDDYKHPMMNLLGRMIDSNLVKPSDYEMYFTKFLLEAKQEMKKQVIAEKKKAIEKAEENKSENPHTSFSPKNNDNDRGNDALGLYATLLLPYWDLHPGVQPLVKQMLQSGDKQLKYNTAILLLRNNKPIPDSLPGYFAAMDEYRFRLYMDLKELQKIGKFPAKYNNHIDLGKSSLASKSTYNRPDTIAFIDRLPTTFKEKKGFVYFFKYKNKKEDLTWKLATVGLVPADPRFFTFDEKNVTALPEYEEEGTDYDNFDFTTLTDTRINPDEPVNAQLQKLLKRMLYSKRKSAREFYGDRNSDRYESVASPIDFRN